MILILFGNGSHFRGRISWLVVNYLRHDMEETLMCQRQTVRFYRRVFGKLNGSWLRVVRIKRPLNSSFLLWLWLKCVAIFFNMNGEAVKGNRRHNFSILKRAEIKFQMFFRKHSFFIPLLNNLKINNMLMIDEFLYYLLPMIRSKIVFKIFLRRWIIFRNKIKNCFEKRRNFQMWKNIFLK